MSFGNVKYLHISLVTSLALLFTAACSEDKDKDTGGDEIQIEQSLSTRVIYGDDDRLDLYQVEDPRTFQLALSTVALMNSADLKKNAKGGYDVNAMTFGKQYNLCASEPFREQDNPAFCSGFLVGPNTIVTAGHCVRSAADCQNTLFVFDYAIHSEGGVSPKSLRADQVYACSKILHTQADPRGADFAVITVDRPVTTRAPLSLRSSGTIAVGEALTVIGHPAGIPTKVAGGASVRKQDKGFFVANLDTYGGNSGSAVFNGSTGVVEGILVRGETDFVYQGSCRVSNVCTNEGCRGEDVTRITDVLPYIPANELVGEPPISGEPPVDGAVEFTSSARLEIPDNDARGVISVLNVSAAPAGRAVKVRVNVKHTWRGDLVLTLVSPDGRQVILSNREGGREDNIVGVFGEDLEASRTLADLSGVSTVGAWKLVVSDRARSDVGVLESWSLIFE